MKDKKPVKKVKSSKVPKLFHKNRAESKFQKKVLAKTFSEKENSFLTDLMSKNDKGEYQLPDEVTQEELKRLRGIAKTVKQNTGVVAFGKIFLLVVIISAVLVFNLVFKDMILEKLLESNLSEVFGAKVDFQALSLDLVNTRIAFGGLQIANKEKPMENLLQLGVTQLDLDTMELLKGKFVVNDISCQDIQWNTPRRVSGALSSRYESTQPVQTISAPDKSSTMAPAAEDKAWSLDFDQIDTQGIMENAKSRLSSMKKIEESSEKLRNLEGNYSGQIGQFNQELPLLKSDVQKISQLNFSKMDMANAQQALTSITAGYSRLESLKGRFDVLSNSFNIDSKSFQTMASDIEVSVKSDYAVVEGFIKAPEAGAAGLVSAVVEPVLKQQLGDIYTYGKMALGLVEKLDFSKQKQNPAAVPAQKIVRRGLDIPFPEKNNPGILIKNASFSVGSETLGNSFGAFIKALSSDPELMDGPAELGAFVKNNELQADILFKIDVRESAENVLNSMIKIKDFQLDLGDALAGLGFSDFDSVLQLDLDLIQSREGLLSGRFKANVNRLKTVPKEGLNKVTREVYNIIERVRDISFSGDFKSQGESFSINMKSSLDKLLEQAVGELISKSLSEAKKMLRQELDSYIAGALKDNKALYGVYREMEAVLAGNAGELGSFRKILDTKKAEAENRIKAIGEEAAGALKNEAGNQINNLKKNFGL
ncbi:MAG: TIGR03545 family protein [Spirochaetales bacterium]|nr:TIGR03545 family protein [Spirochaetales bacterium]